MDFTSKIKTMSWSFFRRRGLVYTAYYPIWVPKYQLYFEISTSWVKLGSNETQMKYSKLMSQKDTSFKFQGQVDVHNFSKSEICILKLHLKVVLEVSLIESKQKVLKHSLHNAYRSIYTYQHSLNKWIFSSFSYVWKSQVEYLRIRQILKAPSYRLDKATDGLKKFSWIITKSYKALRPIWTKLNAV